MCFCNSANYEACWSGLFSEPYITTKASLLPILRFLENSIFQKIQCNTSCSRLSWISVSRSLCFSRINMPSALLYCFWWCLTCMPIWPSTFFTRFLFFKRFKVTLHFHLNWMMISHSLCFSLINGHKESQLLDIKIGMPSKISSRRANNAINYM